MESKFPEGQSRCHNAAGSRSRDTVSARPCWEAGDLSECGVPGGVLAPDSLSHPLRNVTNMQRVQVGEPSAAVAVLDYEVRIDDGELIVDLNAIGEGG